jgi:hypothetical protein
MAWAFQDEFVGQSGRQEDEPRELVPPERSGLVERTRRQKERRGSAEAFEDRRSDRKVVEVTVVERQRGLGSVMRFMK